jgi:pimeloyl-ACP methyl ester carboxylesterase
MNATDNITEPIAANGAKTVVYPRLEELIPAHWQRTRIRANAIQQHIYRTGGSHNHSKPALLLLHGFTEDASGWLRTARALEVDYDVIMPDARSHGHSESANGAFTLPLLAQDVAALIRQLGLERPVLLGHSMGAGVAAQVAAIHPERVRAVILAEPPLRAAPDLAQINPDWYNSWLEWMQTLKTLPHAERMAAGLERLPPNVRTWDAADLVPMIGGLAAFDLSLLELGAALYELPPWTELAPHVGCPTLLLTGDPARGATNTPAAIQALVAQLPNCQHVRMAAGHFLHADQFQAFVAAVREFLESTESSCNHYPF